MDSVNGKNKKIGGRRNDSGTQAESKRMGGVAEKSQSNGTIEISANREDSNRGNPDWKLVPIRDTTAGKIIERLEALEKRHLEYVHAHQARLKARLGESEEAENQFKEETNQIKSDIYYLVTRQESGDDVIEVK
ncbi:hypothetical protein NIES25_51800 [Nostoc linckia NIES-25]|nr:hypothetical protein NIES25_51520 [Nostoc linckia NIES-25]BAY78704.1 hypothetical protein NIES25_51800 [Nostoc linckia NIES-25]